MATVNLYTQTDMSNSVIWYGTVYIANSSQILLSNGYYGGIYYGSGFKYSGYSVTGGTLTGYDGAINVNTYSLTYNLTISVRDLNLNAKTAYNYIQSGNALGLQEWALSGNDALNGSIYNDTLLSYNGNDTLNGGLGNDTMVGGTDNDTYIVDSISDVVTESLNQGTDVIQSSVTYTASANVENLTLTGSSNIDATGNSLANTLTGNSGNNTLDGGAGNDIMVGGAGNDTYIVDSASDVITEGSNAGTDTIQSSITYITSANVEHLTLTDSTNINGTGNTLNNTLTGNTGNNTLDGGAGIDTMIGGLGNDTYIVDNTSDIVTEASSEGTDTIQSSVTFTASAHVENLTLTGTGNINGTGNTLDNSITGNSGMNNINGGDGNDTLSGLAGNDTLNGGNGNDLLFGGLGNDTLTGGAGTDTFVFNTALNASTNRDTITDFSHTDDTIQLSKSVMSALGALGTLSANDFKFSTQTLDTSDRIIYNQTSGALFYDADGSGRSAAVQIALLNSLPTGIDNTDFVII